MAKDGTLRGGARTGAGRKPNSLDSKVREGKVATVMSFPGPPDLLPHEKLTGNAEVPSLEDYMTADQYEGEDFSAKRVFGEIWQWLAVRGCEQLVNQQLIEQYAFTVARWIQCENAVSKYGALSTHPTTGNAIASPYVSMSQNYMKQANQLWNQIYQVVKENCRTEYQPVQATDDPMERLLRAKRG